MTEPDAWSFIRDALTQHTEKLDDLLERVTRVETQTKELCQSRVDAKGIHVDCREEVDQMFHENDQEHAAIKEWCDKKFISFEDRLSPIEKLHAKQDVGMFLGLKVWKVLLAVAGAVYLGISLYGLIQGW